MDEVFKLSADSWPPNRLYCSFSAFVDALVANMDFVQDLLSQKRWDDDPVVTHQQAVLDRNLE